MAGNNYESQVPYPMAQAQQARALRMQAQREVPPSIYPPQTENQRYPAQPALDSDAYGHDLDKVRQQAAGLGFVDPINGSNQMNFATIGLPFVYTLDQAVGGFIELLPGATGSFTVSFTADSDFVAQGFAARATREFIYSMQDSGADRNLQNRPQSAIATLGGLGRISTPTVPLLFKGKTTLQMQITDGGNGSPNIYNGAPVLDANLEPSVSNPAVLVNKIGIFLIGVKRQQWG